MQPDYRPTTTNAFILSPKNFEEMKQIYKKWYQDKTTEYFVHRCGQLGPEKFLVGWANVDDNECTCCGDGIPKSVSMLIKLQQLG